MADLFAAAGEERRRALAPLADRMRPRSIDEVVGQATALGPGAPLRGLLAEGRLVSLILWGPPGSGKTTLARLAADATGAAFVPLSAVNAGVKDVRALIANAREDLAMSGTRTLCFLDEIHRFNKSQQDALLPAVEDGSIVLIGATTENPSFEVNAALRSRCIVVVLDRLAADDIRTICDRALADETRGLGGQQVELTDDGATALALNANGDARTALVWLEACAAAAAPDPADGVRRITPEVVGAVLQKPNLLYDRAGEEHFNIISALHKSVRGSDPDAALYWLARMLVAGEEPLYIARRVVRMASEDIGLADPRALQIAVAAFQAVHFLGMPEGDCALAEAVVYLAVAPKSNRLYAGLKAAKRDVHEKEALPVPMHIRNAVTDLMQEQGYGQGYQYEHDLPDAVGTQSFLPDNLEGTRYYEPSDQGSEAKIAAQLDRWKHLREQRRRSTGEE
ncbi:MAG: replication-associated recombination protein A [Planctomycetota bacterium]|jgi:putative ATPase